MAADDNIPVSFFLSRFTQDLDALKNEILEIKKDIKELQLSKAGADVKTGLLWSILTAAIATIVSLAFALFKGK